MKKLNLTWAQFQELRALCDAIHQSKSLGAQDGELKNNIVESEWNTDGVEIKVEIE